jgi:hypothetical protein
MAYWLCSALLALLFGFLLDEEPMRVYGGLVFLYLSILSRVVLLEKLCVRYSKAQEHNPRDPNSGSSGEMVSDYEVQFRTVLQHEAFKRWFSSGCSQSIEEPHRPSGETED